MGLPGLEAGTSSLSDTIAYVVDVDRCSRILKIRTFPSIVVLYVHCCSGALSSNCPQLSDLRHTGQAIQELYGFTGLAPKTLLNQKSVL